jgi:glycine/D-amino acid oxidase-like deaminating enzyme
LTSQKTVDYTVVGGGIAGTILACTLKKKEPLARVILIDDIRQNVSSQVAAGIFNPITGRLMSLTWKANELFQFLMPFYTDLERELDSQFVHPLPIFRILNSVSDQNDWTGQSTHPAYSRFLSEPEIVEMKGIFNPFGCLVIQNGGWLDVPKFLSAVKNSGLEIVSGTLPLSNRESLETGLKNLGIESHAVILCTGYRAAEDGLTGELGWSPVRGELLRIKHADLPADRILNKGCFILPYASGEWLLGATYDHNLTRQQTDKGKEQLLKKFSQIMDGTPEILEHRWGIRPATKDRRPFIGAIEEGIYLFNGFGSKGVSLVPFLAHHFADSLLSDKSWADPETSVFRFSG